MKRLLFISLCFALCIDGRGENALLRKSSVEHDNAVATASPQLDSTKLAKLDSLLENYYASMIYEPLDVKYGECDFLIESCRDSLVRSWVTGRIIKHYMEPPLMGEEAVQIYVYDKWVRSGAVRLDDDWLDFEARLFADFNRSSLLGMKAPVIELLAPVNSGKISIPEKGTSSVIYFYDTSCSKCRVTSIMLPYTLEDVDFPLNLYLVYCGSDGDEWAEFRSSFSCSNANVRTVHLWDPEVSSDYQTLYGVLATPRMYFIDSEGVIQGRRLDADSLSQILAIYSARPVSE